MSAQASNVEVESKYDVLDRVAGRSLVAAATLGPLQASGPLARVRVVDRYLDTPDARLRAAGWAARTRTVGDRTLLQLKALAAPDEAGVARRAEVEGEAIHGLPVDAWPESDARTRLLDMLGGEPASEVLVLRQDRLTRAFGTDTAALEVSLDRIEVLSGERAVARRLVLEVEQQRAPDAAFRAVLAHLDGLGFLSSARASKLAWGMDVARRAVGDDGLPTLAPIDASFRIDDPTAEVGRVILATQLRTMIERERATQAATGPEEIRRLRVATRRARATLRAFEGSYAGSRPERLRRGLRRFARLLNDVRNLDVLIGQVDDYLAGLEPAARPAVEALHATLEDRRTEALATLRVDMDGDRHRRLLGALADFVQHPGGDVPPVWPPRPRRLSDELGGWIWASFEGLVAWRPILETADFATLHEMRLDVKRIRDLIQVMGPVLDPGAAVVNETLVDLQDALGAMNDAAVAASWLRGYLAASSTRLTPDASGAIDRLAGALEQRILDARTRVPAAWRRVTGGEGRRRMARIIGGI